MDNRLALCYSARAILDRCQIAPGVYQSFIPSNSDLNTIAALCASYINLCEAQTLASQRADNAQTLLVQAQTTVAQLRERAQRAERGVGELGKQAHDNLQRALQAETKLAQTADSLIQYQSAYHALLAGEA